MEEDRVDRNILKDGKEFKTATAMKSFLQRTVEDWNALPDYTYRVWLNTFKRKQWIRENVPVK